jgi:hypothetical protein
MAAAAARLTGLPPASRLVLCVRVSAPALRAGDDWPGVWRTAGLIPEMLHDSESVPGDVEFACDVRRRIGEIERPGGQHVVGCVLTRRLQPGDLDACELVVPSEVSSDIARHWFPLGGGLLPMPLAAGSWSVGAVAGAWNVPVEDVPGLVEELVLAGAVRLHRSAATRAAR